jgi:hypothetical protein
MPNDRDAWKNALRDILANQSVYARLTAEATSRPLPSWSDAAHTLMVALLEGKAGPK